jgi:ring-1,2-phenylacetyl-CoA epoxidase subunit PaaA
MYAQLVETGVKRIKDLSEMSEQERAFQEKIDSEIKIEAKNWMPDAYRQTLIRQISQHAPKSSACCPKATGSPAPPHSNANCN